jgi:hypothetical protein
MDRDFLGARAADVRLQSTMTDDAVRNGRSFCIAQLSADNQHDRCLPHWELRPNDNGHVYSKPCAYCRMLLRQLLSCLAQRDGALMKMNERPSPHSAEIPPRCRMHYARTVSSLLLPALLHWPREGCWQRKGCEEPVFTPFEG